MKAVVFGGKGGPEMARIQEIPRPVAERGEVLVRVRAAALNRADLLQRRGLYPPPPGFREDVPGLEFAGQVSEVGQGVTGWKAGDRVMAIASGEAQAEYVLADPYMLMRIPDGMSFPLAAAIPEAGITAHDALVTLGEMRSGWTVLLHAIGSGVGTMGLQIARAMGGTVIGTAAPRTRSRRPGGSASTTGSSSARKTRSSPTRSGASRASGAFRWWSTSWARPTWPRTWPRSRCRVAWWWSGPWADRRPPSTWAR